MGIDYYLHIYNLMTNKKVETYDMNYLCKYSDQISICSYENRMSRLVMELKAYTRNNSILSTKELRKVKHDFIEKIHTAKTYSEYVEIIKHEECLSNDTELSNSQISCNLAIEELLETIKPYNNDKKFYYYFEISY